MARLSCSNLFAGILLLLLLTVQRTSANSTATEDTATVSATSPTSVTLIATPSAAPTAAAAASTTTRAAGTGATSTSAGQTSSSAAAAASSTAPTTITTPMNITCYALSCIATNECLNASKTDSTKCEGRFCKVTKTALSQGNYTYEASCSNELCGKTVTSSCCDSERCNLESILQPNAAPALGAKVALPLALGLLVWFLSRD